MLRPNTQVCLKKGGHVPQINDCRRIFPGVGNYVMMHCSDGSMDPFDLLLWAFYFIIVWIVLSF